MAKRKHIERQTEKEVAVIWTRVSTKEQAENNLSLETQKNACLEYARTHNIEIDCIKGQTNESAKTQGKIFREMIEYVVSNKKVNIVLCYSYDRFSREGPEAMITKAFLKKHGIRLISITQPIDDDNSAGQLLQNIMFLFSQFENNLRKDKCTAGMISCLEQGDWFSQPPMGYTLDKNNSRKHTYVINEEGELLQQAFLWKATDNITDTQIVRRLRRAGLNIGKHQLSRVFHNPFYCGKIRHKLLGDRIVQGNHPALVSEEIFDKVNGINTHIGYTHAEETPQTPLKRHIKCSICGKVFTGYVVKKKGLWYYKCSTIGCKCNRSAKVIHKKYAELLGSYSTSEGAAEYVADTIKRLLTIKYEEDKKVRCELLQKQGSIQQQIADCQFRFGIGEIPKAVYDVTYAKLLDQLTEIEHTLDSVQNQTSNLADTVDDLIATISKLGHYWAVSSFSIRQEIQKIVFPDGVLWDRVKDDFRTLRVNGVLDLILLLSAHYESVNTKKEQKSNDFCPMVEYPEHCSNLIGEYKSLYRVIDLIHN